MLKPLTILRAVHYQAEPTVLRRSPRGSDYSSDEEQKRIELWSTLRTARLIYCLTTRTPIRGYGVCERNYT